MRVCWVYILRMGLGWLLVAGSAWGGSNLLILIADDVGLDSLPFSSPNAGGSFPPVPNVAALAAGGVVFNQGYAYPTCSPTRAAMLTGRYGFRTGVLSPNSSDQFSGEEYTFPEAFDDQALGYAMASFGKWHLGGGSLGPNELGGWDHFSGVLGGAVPNFFDWTKVVNGVSVSLVDAYATSEHVDDALAWIGARGETNWVVWMGFTAAHTPLHKPPVALHGYDDLSGTSADISAQPRLYFEAMIEALDSEIGRLLAGIDTNETTIVFVGDNGTSSATIEAPYDIARRAKGSLYEGGTHVPFVIAGADVVAGGRSVDTVVHVADLFATLIELGGGRVPSTGVDSRSLVPFLRNELFGDGDGLVLVESDWLQRGQATGRAVRDARYKLIEMNQSVVGFCDLWVESLEASNLLGGGLSSEQLVAYARMTNYLEEASAGRVSPFSMGASVVEGVLRVEWESEPFRSYSLRAAEVLMGGVFSEVVVSNLPASPPLNAWVVPVGERQRFFRVEAE